MTTRKPRAKKQSENRPKTDKRKAPRSAWKPGQSGNPGGRPKIPEATKEAFKEASPEALECLREIMRSGGNDSARVAAAIHILDRAMGKVSQGVELTGKEGGPMQVDQHTVLEGFSNEQLVRLASAALAISEGGDDQGGSQGAPGDGQPGVDPSASGGAAGADPAPVAVPEPPVS